MLLLIAVGIFKSENVVWNHPQFRFAVDFYAPFERRALAARRVDQLSARNKRNSRIATACQLNCDHDFAFLNGVLEEQWGKILLWETRRTAAEGLVLAKQTSAARIKCINKWPTPAAVEVFYLAARPINVAVMKKQLQAPEHLLAAAGDQSRNIARSEQSMSIQMSEDINISLSDLNVGN